MYNFSIVHGLIGCSYHRASKIIFISKLVTLKF